MGPQSRMWLSDWTAVPLPYASQNTLQITSPGYIAVNWIIYITPLWLFFNFLYISYLLVIPNFPRAESVFCAVYSNVLPYLVTLWSFLNLKENQSHSLIDLLVNWKEITPVSYKLWKAVWDLKIRKKKVTWQKEWRVLRFLLEIYSFASRVTLSRKLSLSFLGSLLGAPNGNHW